jgi:hypothetical protein
MEPEGSLPCLQEPATGPCPEPDESNRCIRNLLTSTSTTSSHLRLGLSTVFFP